VQAKKVQAGILAQSRVRPCSIPLCGSVQECKKNCPVVRMGKMCIEVDGKSKIAFISEELCIGCGICVR